jgi:hypothetical protein
MTRAQKVAAINRAKREWPELSDSERAGRLGMSLSAYRNLVYDPDGSKQRERRLRYQLPCPSCGTPMDGSNGRASTPALCVACDAVAKRESTYWTPERRIAAAREWAAMTGYPPTVSDWLRAQIVNGYRFPCFAQCYGSHANNSTPWASWSEFLAAAGFPGRTSGRRLNRTAVAA